MSQVPIKQVVREDGLIELPIVLDFDFGDFTKVVGYAVVDPDLLPQGTGYCFALSYTLQGSQTHVTGLSVVEDADYREYLNGLVESEEG